MSEWYGGRNLTSSLNSYFRSVFNLYISILPPSEPPKKYFYFARSKDHHHLDFLSIMSQMSSAYQQVVLGPSLVGCGNLPVFTPSHHVVFDTGMYRRTVGSRTSPVSGRVFSILSLVPLFLLIAPMLPPRRVVSLSCSWVQPYTENHMSFFDPKGPSTPAVQVRSFCGARNGTLYFSAFRAVPSHQKPDLPFKQN